MLSESHKKRIVTGLILAALLVAGLLLGGWLLRLLVTVAAVLGLWELYRMFWPGRKNYESKIMGYAAGALICLGSGLWFDLPGVLAIICLAAFFAIMRFLLLYGRGDDSASIQDNLPLIFGLIYIPVTLQFALNMQLSEQFLVILGAVASDIGAYYAGSNLGRHKIWPRVSPNKSWEGSIGAIFTNLFVIGLFGFFVGVEGLEHITMWQWGLAGACLSVMAQLGDFFESAFKRAVGVKDSSNLLPGHGGVLDRLDSILFVLPAYMLIKHFFMSF